MTRHQPFEVKYFPSLHPFCVGTCIVMLLLVWQLFGKEQTCSADEPKVAQRVPLPIEWVEDHNVVAIYEGTGLYAWFPRNVLPYAYSNDVNTDSSLPSALFFRGNFPRSGLDKKTLVLRDLERFPGIRSLTIVEGDRLEPSEVEEIFKCRQLRALLVPQAPINDMSLKKLCASLKQLVVLDLSMSDITDDSVPTLIELHELQVLNVSGTNMSIRGVEVLRAKKRNCAVVAERWPYSFWGERHWQEESVRKWRPTVTIDKWN